MGILAGGGPLHIAIVVFFDFLILSLFGRIIMSYVQAFMRVSPGNPFSRFFFGVTAPMYDPLYRRLPTISLGMFDVTSTICLLSAVVGAATGQRTDRLGVAAQLVG